MFQAKHNKNNQLKVAPESTKVSSFLGAEQNQPKAGTNTWLSGAS
jgi:hypothetical protein